MFYRLDYVQLRKSLSFPSLDLLLQLLPFLAQDCLPMNSHLVDYTCTLLKLVIFFSKYEVSPNFKF
jgi:hypothetical protein